MYLRCLDDETRAHKRAELAAQHVSSNYSASTELQKFAPGTEVVIEGLTKAPSFNGVSGVVQCWGADSGRYSVLLESANAKACWAKVKQENLQPRLPPPPATIALCDERAEDASCVSAFLEVP